jgi:predicted ATPase
MKPAEEVAREIVKTRSRPSYGATCDPDQLMERITAALTAEREETLKDARVYMDHSPACAIAIALKQPYRGAIPECTCGLDKLLFSPAA